ncbi:hypothetical protein IW261DRAFT_1571875 [Armillaria novae-zelandiae]|uniref:Uncharacterized protein n=1 Tax=Armillaria novae-zelandiae TaxID=153914 RepID=A0AA39U0G0_9AGAR|nr:hypothetical protein IW261DRAFT_1571875 [Armillaria novae-zelandiae]
MSLIHERPQCPYCLKHFHVNGIGNHKRTCKQRIEQDVLDSQFNVEQNTSRAANTAQEAINTPRLLFDNQVSSNTGLDSCFEDLHLDSQRDLSSSPSFEPGSSEDEDENSSSDATINDENAILDLSQAEHLLVTFKKEKLSLEYKEETQEYMLHFRPLWDWTLNLLSDPTLSPFFVWDAVKIFQLDEKTNTRMRIFDEPWTGDLLWKVQSSLPPGGKPLAYILYADKTRLSSFGTAKGYLVMACIANLPDAIRNGKGWGGGTVVGWLPIVEEDPKYKGKLLDPGLT